MKTIQTTEFVKRQNKSSRFSYPAVGWDLVEEWTEQNLTNNTQGYRQGVIIVHLPEELAKNFRCGVTHNDNAINWDTISESRREGEASFNTRVAVVKEKPEAKYCDIILYHKDVMKEDPLNDSEDLGTWNIVSVNCRETKEEYPIPPLTMARNLLVKKGGTKGDYTADQFAESIWFWSQHSLCLEEEEWAYRQAGKALAKQMDDMILAELINEMKTPDPDAEQILEDNFNDLVGD